MFTLIKKDLFRATITGFILVPALSVYWLSYDAELDSIVIILLGILIHVIPLSSVLIVEQEEDKHHGYEFLRALPVSSLEIVRTKFLFTGVIVGGLALYAIAFMTLFELSPARFGQGRDFLISAAGSSLTLVGLVYMGIYRYGFTAFTRYFLAGFLILGPFPQVLIFNLSSQSASPDLAHVVGVLGSIDPWIAGVVGLAIYTLLMYGAHSVKEHLNIH